LSDSFPIQNGLKQGDVSSPVLFNFALEYAIRRDHEYQVGLKLNRTHKLLSYAEDANLLGDNIYTINKNTESLIDVSKEIGLEVNMEKTKYLLVSRYQNGDQIRDIKVGNKSFENVSHFEYFGTTVKKQTNSVALSPRANYTD
jgi:hypothetical protein